ncbi:MAG TPA: NUDIX domain-containing protein [Gammaproteobacteria bacterium]|nr:NUDIX domain-containing protein [Gammaproteobacteria bacterium]
MSGAKPLHVLVGLIGDARGRWLVNRRRPGTDLAGFWEFPGGKRQVGETPFAALRRELDEELGIDVLAAEPWLELTHDYPDKSVLLDVWRVLDYRGEVTAREGQALDWVAPARLAALPLLPADLPIVAALQRGDASFSKSQAGTGRPD